MEQQWCSALHLVQPADASRLAVVKGLVLSSGPTFERAINVLEDAKHGGPVERAVVLPPPCITGLYSRAKSASVTFVWRLSRQRRAAFRPGNAYGVE